MLLEVQDLMLSSMDGTEGVIAGESMSKGFATCSVLLASVGGGGFCDSIKHSHWCCLFVSAKYRLHMVC